MASRILIAGILCLALAATAWQLHRPPSAAAAMARQMTGEHWYTLHLNDARLGYWRSHTRQNDAGDWLFESEQRFAMRNLPPVTTRSLRTFAGDPPHRLLNAAYLQTGSNEARGVRIDPTENGYRTERLPAGSSPVDTGQWQYLLSDYLAFELWLDDQRPAPGVSRTVNTLDFERGALTRRAFDVAELNEHGYLVENAAPLSATRIQLDDRFTPLEMQISGLFTLRRSSRSAALAPRSTLVSASYYIPSDRRLLEHTRISRLVLDVTGEPAADQLFANASRNDEGWQLIVTGETSSSRPPAAEDLAPTLHFPSRDPAVVAIAERTTEDAETDLERVEALVRYVNDTLRYRPGDKPRHVLTLLDEPRGDCTEFADLLTTLARSIGLPARTVFGLAYTDTVEPAFAYHAWNEVAVDGRWIAVDPTWRQLRVDATHIPLPADETAALRLLTGAVDLTFNVREVEYFDQPTGL